jgi:arylsulfatase B
LSTNQPFFLWLAFNAPHSPFHLPPLSLHSYTNLPGTPTHISANPQLYFKAMVEAMDTEIGRLFQYLDSNNLRDSTTIIFIGDNGEERKIAQIQDTLHAKASVFEPGVHVPMIISGPSVVDPGRQSDALVSTPDLFATILDLSGFPNWINDIPAAKLPVDSKSLFPVLQNDTTDVRDWIFTEQFEVISKPADAKAMRTKTHKLIKFDNGLTHFYDLTVDSLELNNLFGQTLTTIQTQQYNFLCNELNALLNQSTCTPVVSGATELDGVLNGLSVFPNPVKDLVNVSWSHHEIEEVQLFDPFGRIVMKGNLGVWDVSSLYPGMYFISPERYLSSRAVKVLKVD